MAVTSRPADDDKIRLHRYLAQAGVTSRRKAEVMITDGRVSVNGHVITEMGVKVGPSDLVQVDGVSVQIAKAVYAIFYKPKGVITTMDDPQHRQTIASYIPDLGVPLKPIGRLDMDTDGLLLLTSDGDFAMRISHPRYGIEKEYHASVEGIPGERELEKLRKGVFVDGKRTAPAKVQLLGSEEKRGTSRISLIVHEGRNRQIRLMCESVGHPVTALRRVRIGPLVLRGMQPGECRILGQKDVQNLKRLIGLE